VTRVCSTLSQVRQLIPRLEFESAGCQHDAERHARGSTSWGQFIVMPFCQPGHAKSLREICGRLAASEMQEQRPAGGGFVTGFGAKLRCLGLPTVPSRSTLVCANEHRPGQLHRTMFEQLLAKFQTSQPETRKKRKFRFKNPLLSLDDTAIGVCATMFDWAKFRMTKGAVKLHLLPDQDVLPSFAVVTEGT
jgi:hypothetical protein